MMTEALWPKNHIYTGIGSRETPVEILSQMTIFGQHMAAAGWCLRSGGAPGADSAFAAGVEIENGWKEIYLPWEGFNGNQNGIVAKDWTAAMDLAEEHHPAWDRCSLAAMKLHARNGFQVLGINLTVPSRFVVCWTKDGKGGGGTGQALRIARAFNVPIYDLGLPGISAYDVLMRFIRD